jgi:hypothetical protein
MPKAKPIERYLRRIEAAEKQREQYEEIWVNAYKRWRSHIEDIIDPTTGKVDTSRSNIFIPYTFLQVETIVPRLVETLFASRPYVSVIGRTPNDQQSAKPNEVLLDWQMNERMSFRRLFHKGLKGLAIYGTAVTYTGWKWEQQQRIKKEMMPVTVPEGQALPAGQELPVETLQPVKTEEVVYDDPEVQFIDLGAFYVDPAAEDIESARYCGHAEYLTKEQIQQRVESGLFKKVDFKRVKPINPDKSHKNDRLSEVGLPTVDEQDDENGFYEVMHYWEDSKHAVIINRTELVQDGDNPFWHGKKPYSRGVYCLVPGEFYGMGIPEVLGDLQDELNTERNMRIDYRAFLLRRMFKVRRGADINKKQLKWRQGGILEVDAMDDVMEMGLGDNSGNSFNEESTIKADMQDTTGGHDVVMGTSSSKETATGTMTKDNNAAMRFKLVISSIENDLLVPVARMMLQLNHQYLSDEKMIRVAEQGDDQFAAISEADIQGEFDLIAAGSSVEPQANKEAHKQRMIELYGMLKGEPMLTQFPDKRRNLLKALLGAFDFKNVDDLIPSDQELQMPMQPQLPQAPPGAPPPEPNGANVAMVEEAGLIG